ncbi:adenosine receptor A3-like [Montipora foliosa]|uniref:adenosine receptor A3-like n=1 Tax=Montipora foliosa TaxID=591990 RepID=UPI0035F1D3B1
MAISNYTQDDVLQSFRQLCAAQSIATEEVHKELTILAVVNIFLSIFAILGNTVILVALNKVSFLHSQSRLLFRSLVTTDLCVGIIVEPLFVGFLISIVKENWIVCFYMAQVSGVTGYALCATSLLILTAISVDRLLALLPGIRYRQVVTTRRVRLMVTLSWVVTIFFSTMYSWNYRISLWYVQTLIILCSFISLISYTKIFIRLRHHQVQTQDRINPAHSFPTRMARFRKTVISALWVHLAFVFCYLPLVIVKVLEVLLGLSSSLRIANLSSGTLVCLNSAMNPIIYCWRITEVRKAVRNMLKKTFSR